jgi:predicted MPP superfamily phosphohydrolase
MNDENTPKITITRRGLLKALWKVTLGFGLAGVAGYGYGFRFEPRWLATERVNIPLKGLDPALEGLRMVCVSDFHLHPYVQIGFVEGVVEAVNRLQPDLVCLAGDYVLERADSVYELAPALARLESRYGVACVLGNHDLWTDSEVVQAGLEQAGLLVLVNEGIELQVDGGTLYVAGVDDGWSGQPDLEAALERAPDGAPVVLLAHEPDFADTFSLDERVGLQVSGHSHGGQVRLPGIGALILPRYAAKYDQGLYQVNDMWLYTTRGVGVIGPPVRINCRPEITEITLVCSTA